jgi:hypothetical protein
MSGGVIDSGRCKVARSSVRRSVARVCAAIFLVLAAPIQAQHNDSSGGVVRQLLEKIFPHTAATAIEIRDSLDAQAFRNTPFNTGFKVHSADYGWQMGLRIHGSSTRCGAILISPSYVLTAAHCLDRAGVDVSSVVPVEVSQIEAFAPSEQFGQAPLQLDTTWPVHIHELYKKGPRYSYDAALFRLAVPFTGGRPAPIRAAIVDVGDAVTSGWGDYPDGSTGVLRAVRVPVVDQATCRSRLSSAKQGRVTDATLCTLDARADSCGRDSGGPLVIGTRDAPQTIGIVSWGDVDTCGYSPSGRLVGGYTRASSLAPWVIRETGDTQVVTDRKPGPLMTVTALLDNLK